MNWPQSLVRPNRRSRWFPVLIAAFVTLPALAQESPEQIAKRAAGQLEAARQALETAEKGSERVEALTRTIRAYEEGLTALREGLRRAALREAAIRAKFEAERERVARLLGVLQSLGEAPGPLSLLHPSGPVGTARSGMIVADITPALQREAAALKAELDEVALLRALQETALGTLQDGLEGVQRARTELSQAISNRTDLPRRYLEEPEALETLLASAGTLTDFAAGLAQLKVTGADAPLHVGEARGALALPVDGQVIRRAGEPDAAGIERPGVIIATAPRALVTAPWTSTIRYRGPLLDYGNVMILEPGNGFLLVLAGLSEVYGATGEVLPAGTPVGLMGGDAPDAGMFLASARNGTGAARSETLYMELRQDGEPVDPAVWFAFD